MIIFSHDDDSADSTIESLNDSSISNNSKSDESEADYTVSKNNKKNMQQTIENLRLQLKREQAEKREKLVELERIREKHESLLLATSNLIFRHFIN